MVDSSKNSVFAQIEPTTSGLTVSYIALLTQDRASTFDVLLYFVLLSYVLYGV